MSSIQFCLLTHPSEFAKKTNTGRLVQQLLPETLTIKWSRVEPSQCLIDLIHDRQCQTYLVLPQQYAIYQNPLEERATPGSKKIFILLDGTWQQARKMYRQSHYLHSLPLCSLSHTESSIYTLRRNQLEQGLCTAEVAAQLLKQSGEESLGTLLMDRLSTFCAGFY